MAVFAGISSLQDHYCKTVLLGRRLRFVDFIILGKRLQNVECTVLLHCQHCIFAQLRLNQDQEGLYNFKTNTTSF